MLSEDDIKHAFLPFLKEFYKYRYEYRPESIHTELDNVGEGGLVADGMVSFRKNDGSPFVCTYEATSADKAEEVKYSLNVLYFTWDCLAFSAFVSAIAYALAFVSRKAWLKNLEWSGNAGFILGIGVIGFFAWYFIMRSWRKYRYIYAVEQFKQYFADEQWVALADDVFPAPTDPYLIELKNQCVYNGFGLALVPSEGEVRVLATPSRMGIYGKDRRMVHWVTRLNWYQAMSQNVSTLSRYRPTMPGELIQVWNKLWRPVQYLLITPVKKGFWKAFSGPLGQKSSVFDRFMQAHSVQKWVFSLSVVAIVSLSYRILTTREDKVEDSLTRQDGNPEDQYGYLYEGEPVKYRDPRGIPKQDPEPVTSAREEEVQTINLSGSTDDEAVQTINLSGSTDPEPAEVKPTPVPYNATEKKSTDPCNAFSRQKGWIIQDNSFANKNFADERVATLKRKGISGDLIPRSCLGDGIKDGYIVRLGSTYSTETTARSKSVQFRKDLERKGLLQSILLVRRIN